MSELPAEVEQLSPLQRAVLALKKMRAKLDTLEQEKTQPIAIVGMGCRFPGGSDNPERFWNLLREGRDAVVEIDRWDLQAYYDPDPDKPGKIYTRNAALIRDVDGFDSQFFNVSPREAQSLDPQQRLLLTVSWEALENAGQSAADLRSSRTGVFMGLGQIDYAQLQMHCGDPARITAYDGTGNSVCFGSGRLSYFLGLHGPSIALDTACSSSLVALHLACQSLRSGESDLALAGGVQLMLTPDASIFLCRAKALSPDGRCKTFDASADGYGRGEGCGVIVLKRLSDAVANGDNVVALVRGSAVNHDGPSSGLTVPNVHAQEGLIRRALESARVSPDEVSYVEAHGTGTALGDPIEARALGAVFQRDLKSADRLLVGSVKTNVGHLEAASGVAGLIKVVLALQREEIPEHLHLTNPSPYIPWNDLPFSIPTSRTPWPRRSKSRLAGVSSFGISGTNAHVVLEEAPFVERPQADVERPLHVLVLSAKTKESLRELAGRYEEHLARASDTKLADICFTASTGRTHFSHRLCVIAASTSEAIERLAAYRAGRESSGVKQGHCAEEVQVRPAFRFNGKMWGDGCIDFYSTQPVFRRALDRCGGRDLLTESQQNSPATVFAVQSAIDEVWKSWGIQPASENEHFDVALDLQPDWRQMLETLADLYLRGARVDWKGFDRDYTRQRIPLPTYPFEYKRHWIGKEGKKDRLADWIYGIEWERREWKAGEGKREKGVWIVLAEKAGGVGEGVARLLEEDGEQTVVVSAGEAGEIGRVVREAGRLLRGVVHCWSLDAAKAGELTLAGLEEAWRQGCGSLQEVMKEVIEAKEQCKVWVVTRNAVEAGEGELEGLAQAPVWGMGKVLALEHGELWGGLVDLGGEEVEGLVEEMRGGGDGEPEVALRGGERYVPRLVERRVEGREGIGIRGDGVYLITGGLGALGLRTAEWLVEGGARELVLVGRRGAGERAEEAVSRMRAAGAEVRIAAADVGDVEQMKGVMEGVRGRLRGVVHAAGVGGGEESLRAKVAGSWVLGEMTRGEAVDFFVGYSSIASVWGSKGQGYYAAGNRFVDMMGVYRRRQGKAGQSVNWGPWSGGGMASEEGLGQLGRMGVGAIEPGEGMGALGRLLGRGEGQAVAAKVDWKRFKAVYEVRGRGSLLEGMGVAEEIKQGSGDSELRRRLAQQPPGERRTQLRKWVQGQVGEVLGFKEGQRPDAEKGFFELGMDSLLAVELRKRMESSLGVSLHATVAFDHPQIEKLTAHLIHELGWDQGREEIPAVRPDTRRAPDEPIAIIGMGCRFPGGANTPEAFWQLLRNGVNAVGHVPPDRWDAALYYDAKPGTPGKMVTQEGGFLRQVEYFDAQYFGISPREAVSMDPQQRLVLETSVEALERAGQTSDRLAGSPTGVFLGISNNDYAQLLMTTGRLTGIDPYFVTGNSLNAAAGRISYILGFRGPSMAVDTACSSSLVAVHLACQSLRAGECEQALAGGVNLILTPAGSIATSRAHMLSQESRCKTFDAGADGYVRAEGCGVVLLKPLDAALRDGDTVLAVIRGSAVNQDGASGGFTVPSGPAQQELIRRALKMAGIQPAHVDYVEAHGTGTALGDPIEVGALAAVLGEGRAPGHPLRIGSVKANIGHMESAAGIGGLIKTVLALQHKEIPPHRNFHQPNPLIPWAQIPVLVGTEILPWQTERQTRIAGVSSFGFSGTNAHVLLEEAPSSLDEKVPHERSWHLFTLSAKTGAALTELARRYAEHLDSHPELSIGDICFTANAGRQHHEFRLEVVTQSPADLKKMLAAGLGANAPIRSEPPRVLFVFPEAAGDIGKMGRELYESHADFRRSIDECAAIVRGTPEEGSETAVLFAAQYALAELWRSWGIQPAAVFGEGCGQQVAACVAGVLSLEDSLKQATGQMSISASNGLPAVPILSSCSDGFDVFLQMGAAEHRSDPRWLSSFSESKSDWQVLLESLGKLYRQGEAVDWIAFDRPFRRQRCILPTYPFERLRFWPDLKTHVDLPLAMFRHRHIVSGRAVLPASMQLAMALAAGREVTQSQRLTVENLNISQAFFLDETLGTRVRVDLKALGDGAYSFSIPGGDSEVASSGVILSESPQRNEQIDLGHLRAEFATEIALADFVRELNDRGIEFAADHGIENPALMKLWGTPSKALGELRISEGADFPNPTLLDGCFQVLAAAVPHFARKNTYLQVGIGRFVLHTSTRSGPLWAIAEVKTDSDGRSLNGSVRVMACDGWLIAEIEHVVLKRTGTQDNRLRDWLYEVEWRPQAVYGRRLEAETLASPVEVVKGLKVEADLGEYYEVVRQLEEVSVDYVLRALLGMGWQCSTGERFSTDELRRELGVVGKYERLLGRLLEMLEEEGVVRRVGERWEVVKRREARDPAVEIARLRRSCPAAEAELTLLERCGSGLREVLRGEREALPLLFPEGDLSTASRLYGDSPAARVMNKLVQQAVAGMLQRWPAGSGLRVLEVGAGTGGTTEYVLQALKGEETQYAYTDISGRFVGEGEEKFRGWGKVRGEVLDIERSPGEQGFGGRKYELIVAANVLHATRDLRESLGHVRELLAPGGMLVLLEGTERVRFIDLIFGLTEGWWRYRDEELRPSYPLLGASQWTALLEECGFQQASALAEGPQGVILAREPTGVPEVGRWLILADRQGVGKRLTEMLEMQGEKVTLAFTEAPFDGLLEQAGGDDLTGVVHLCSLDAESTETLTAASLRVATKRSCGSALELVQALVKRSSGRPPRLWLVTRNAQPVNAGAESLSLSQSPISGLAKTIAREHPELRCTAIDLEAGGDSSTDLFNELWPPVSDREERLAFRAGRRFVSRLVRSQEESSPRTPALRGDATYLITGGTGGIGLRVAEWMAQQGARHLVLVARNASRHDPEGVTARLRAAGVSVVRTAADVSDPVQVARVLKSVADSMPELRGIMHCAGVFDDRLLIDHEWRLFDKVFGPKMIGAWNLHELTRKQTLDFFVVFSSAASLLGASGLGNYVAANEFLDVLAHERVRSGLAALSINWGPWDRTGMAGEVTESRRLQWAGLGLESLPPEQALAALGIALGQDRAQIAVLNANWRLPENPFFESIRVAEAAPPRSINGFRQQLLKASTLDQRELLADHVRSRVAKVLGLNSSAPLDPQRGFFDLGLDSLASIELRNELQTSLGCTLSSTLTFLYPNLDSLVDYLAKEVLDRAPAASSNGHARNSEPDMTASMANTMDVRIARELEALQKLLN